jgi:CBS domain-containing protein
VEDAMRPAGGPIPAGSGPSLYPDLTLDAALRLLAEHSVLPVVSRTRPDRVVGLVTLEDVHRAYGIAPSAIKESDTRSNPP